METRFRTLAVEASIEIRGFSAAHRATGMPEQSQASARMSDDPGAFTVLGRLAAPRFGPPPPGGFE
jgi:hypothetical protein